MIDKAKARCNRCGSPLDEAGYCQRDDCPSNDDTIRPRPSHPHAIRQPVPSGTFSVRESQRTTYNEMFCGHVPYEQVPTAEAIPSQPRVPEFSDEELAESERYDPPTRRDLPQWRGPVPPPKPARK